MQSLDICKATKEAKVEDDSSINNIVQILIYLARVLLVDLIY